METGGIIACKCSGAAPEGPDKVPRSRGPLARDDILHLLSPERDCEKLGYRGEIVSQAGICSSRELGSNK